METYFERGWKNSFLFGLRCHRIVEFFLFLEELFLIYFVYARANEGHFASELFRKKGSYLDDEEHPWRQ